MHGILEIQRVSLAYTPILFGETTWILSGREAVVKFLSSQMETGAWLQVYKRTFGPFTQNRICSTLCLNLRWRKLVSFLAMKTGSSRKVVLCTGVWQVSMTSQLKVWAQISFGHKAEGRMSIHLSELGFIGQPCTEANIADAKPDIQNLKGR